MPEDAESLTVYVDVMNLEEVKALMQDAATAVDAWAAIAHDLAEALRFKCEVHGYVKPERDALRRYDLMAEAMLDTDGSPEAE